jgi:hypothetical protein
LNISNSSTPKQNQNHPTTPAQRLLQQDVTRKEFMAIVGLGALSVLGFSSIIHFLTGHSARPITKTNRGYSAGPYGG